MKRIGILTAGGDTPALNAAILELDATKILCDPAWPNRKL